MAISMFLSTSQTSSLRLSDTSMRSHISSSLHSYCTRATAWHTRWGGGTNCWEHLITTGAWCVARVPCSFLVVHITRLAATGKERCLCFVCFVLLSHTLHVHWPFSPVHIMHASTIWWPWFEMTASRRPLSWCHLQCIWGEHKKNQGLLSLCHCNQIYLRWHHRLIYLEMQTKMATGGPNIIRQRRAVTRGMYIK
jgi:hypothetical protein